MDENYLMAAVRYIELNPVRAHLVKDPVEYRWSSANAHMKGRDDGLVVVGPLLNRIQDWGSFLQAGVEKEKTVLIRRHERTGRPLGRAAFLIRLENELGKRLTPLKGGRPRKQQN
jgi:putative transposase